jgi:VWFA-related protein
MARRVAPAALIALLLAIAPTAPLNAQTGGVESNLPEAGFGPPPAASTPVAAPAPGAASAPAGIALPASSPTPTIHVYSRETIVDVLVTDDKGQPVRGLTRADFTILEDGQPQPIRGFSESSTTAPPPPPPNLPPNTFTNANTLPASGPVQIFLIPKAVIPSALLAGRIVSVPPAMLDYLRTMPAGTRVAIFTFSPATALQRVQDFTTDGAAAASAASRIKPDVYVGPPFDGYSVLMQHIAAMAQLASYVAGIHGRKNLIWVTRRMPLMIVRDGGGARDMSITHRLMDTYEIFSREQISIYPVDPVGVHSPMDWQQQEVADETGGTNENTNDIRGEIARIVDRSSESYTLSFMPRRPNEDARFHSIKIEVDRPGVHLTYRSGYDDDHPRPPNGMLKADLPQGPMRLGALPATQLLFTLKVEPAKPGERESKVNITDKHHAGSAKDQPYNAVFTFDPTQIAFSETPDGKRTAKLEFDLGVFDIYSLLGPVRSQTITLNVDASGYNDFMRKPFHFTLPIPMPTGQQTLRAGLFDTVSGKAGTLQVPITVPKQ